MRDRTFILSLASLLGTIIGAGIFAIPYMVAKSGILICFFYFLVLGAILLFLHLFFGEIVLRTKAKHRLIGYAGKYLGKKAKILTTCSTFFGTTGALLIYIILAGHFLKIIFPSLSFVQASSIVWAILSFLVFFGIRSIARSQLFMNIMLFGVFLLIIFLSFPKIEPSNLILINSQNIFLPYGIILFSLIGLNAVPEIEKILLKKAKLKKVIFLSVIISVGFYFLFGVIISGVTGQNTSPNAFQNLASVLGEKIIFLGALFGLFCVATSFLILTNYLKNTLILDYNFAFLPAFLLVCLIPLFLFLIGIKEFMWLIALVGTLMGLIEGTMICLIYRKAKKKGKRKPEYSLKIPNTLLYLIVIVLVLGTISQIIYYLK